MCDKCAYCHPNNQDPVTGTLYPVREHDHDDHRWENLLRDISEDDLDG